MKIAVIGSKGLPPKQGGIEHHCAEIYTRMVAQGHSVDLYARPSYTDQAWGQRQNYKGINVISLPSISVRGIDAFVSSAIAAIAASKEQYDIIHFHALGPALFSALPKIASPAKVVVTCHGLDWQRAKWGNISSRLIRMGEQSAVRFADAIVTVSEDLQTYFMESYDKETTYITNAPASYVETDSDFSYVQSLGLQQDQYILFLGRLVPEKRPELLIKAFQALQPPGWKLVLVGNNSNTPSYTSELFGLAGEDPNILFAGELRGKELAEMVRGAGLFVLPSDVEGLPLAMLEAMQEGIPVLASDIPVNQRLLGKDRGILFQAGNLDSCIAGLNRAMTNPQELKAIAQRAKTYVQKHHNWDKITEECLYVYDEVRFGRTSSPTTKRSWVFRNPQNQPAIRLAKSVQEKEKIKLLEKA
ncbi:glycosyltransferase family 4 protein [Microcoleus sp. FACHB-1515]|uniref:glycosyltransferase family 4 protein n=1 Tax=Cyanophyceae TaxID=3028117 RepID=UPI00168449B8|nr:glycosyltransferase family 4 protein [Microcoleus sp. FACHB-1515]MBD2089093.1 glycosyltransferase family 4 protein [Microcoleus sp. FACHB-1515]